MAYESTSLPSGSSGEDNPLSTVNWEMPDWSKSQWNPFKFSSIAMQYGTQMNPENSAQWSARASEDQQQSQSSLGSGGDFEKAIKAFTDFKKLYSGTGGIPMPGSSDVRMHYGANGQVYYTGGMSTEEQEKERQRAEPPHVSSGIAPFTPNAPKSWETPEAKKAQSESIARRDARLNEISEKEQEARVAKNYEERKASGITESGIGSFFAKQAADQAAKMKTSPEEAEEPGMTAKESAESAADSLKNADNVTISKYGYAAGGKGNLSQGARDFLQQKANEARANAEAEEKKKKKK